MVYLRIAFWIGKALFIMSANQPFLIVEREFLKNNILFID